MAYKGKKILAVIPARGGSKGIYRKNLTKIGDFSLIAHAAQICSELDWLDNSIISTDDKKMSEEGIKFGLGAPFIRPKKLATDKASAIDVWKHAFIESEKHYNESYDISILMEPSSPFRKAKHITQTIEKLISGGFDSVLTVSETDSKSHPLKQLIFEGDYLEFYDDEGEKIVARQQLKSVYHRNGVAYSMTRECLLNQKAIIGKNTSAILINDYIVNLDTENDLFLAELLSEKNKK